MTVDNVARVSFASLARPEVSALIERFGSRGEMTLIVGAGVSMEAGLPSWRALIERLLARVAKDNSRLRSAALRDEWIAQTLHGEDLLAAAATVEALASAGLDEILPEALYGSDGASSYEPGPIADEIARLRSQLGDELMLLTTNYDELIERALRRHGFRRGAIRSYVQRREPAAGVVPVTHLHGFAGRGAKPRRLVLTEEHYHRMQRGSSWQERLVTDRLASSNCLFIGTTLTDPNLIRYLYGYRKQHRRHAAVFIRQGGAGQVSPEVRAAREHATAKRWERQGVDAIFLDHFADAAQLVHEIGLRRRVADGYVPVEIRAGAVIAALERVMFESDASIDDFGERQVLLSRWLRSAFQRVLDTATAGVTISADERIAVALWLLTDDGRALTGWAHSDRAHQDPRTVEAIPIAAESEWVAARTVCHGVRHELDRDNAVSRWRFVRGLPLVVEQPTRLPIGCVTLSSTKRGADSILTRLDTDATAELHNGILAAIYDVLTPMTAEGSVVASVRRRR